MKFGSETNDYKVALAVSFMLALIVFLPVLMGHNFPLWSSDNLFGSYPPLEMSRRQFLSGDAAWFPLAGRGIDFSASVNNFAYSPVFQLIFFSSAGATFIASAIVQFVCFWGIGFVFYFVVKNIVKDRNSALFALIAYQLSFATLYYLQTFPNIVLQFFFLLAVLTVQSSSIINASLLTSILAAAFSTILLTGHVVYGVYFMIAHLLVTGNCLMGLDSKKQRNKLMFAYVAGVILAALIAQYRLIPFLMEVLNGSRVQGNFIPGVLFRPIAVVQLFIPEIGGASINKSKELTTLLSLKDTHSTFLYCGIAGILLAMGAVQIKTARFWFLISLYFVLEVAFPAIIGIFSNAFFYPFQHGSHLYLASFFWTITAATTMSHLSDSKQRGQFERLLSRFKVLFVIFLFGIIFAAYASMLYLNVSIWIAKILGMLVTAALVFYIYKNYRLQETFSGKLDFSTMKRLAGFTVVVLVYAAIAFVYSTPVGRNAVLFLSASIAILGLGFPMFERQILDFSGQLSSIIWILIAIGLIYGLSEFVMPLLPPIKSIDYPLDGYFRLSNEYSRLHVWRNEWIALVVLSLYKFYLVVFWLLRIIRPVAFEVDARPTAALLILLALADQFPAFLEFEHYLSKPFVKVDYNKLFAPIETNLESDPFGYRLTNVNKALPVSTLFDYRNETEPLSNLPYAFGYRSYGGVNSQLPKRERIFYDTYVEHRTLNDKVLPNEPIDEIAVGTNYTDQRLLVLLGVKYGIKGQLAQNLSSQTPFLVGQEAGYNIVQYGTAFYGIPQATGAIDLTKVDPAKIPGVLVASSIFEVKSKIEERPVPEPVLVGQAGKNNIVHYGAKYYGIPQSTGALDLKAVDPATIPGILLANSLVEIQCLYAKQGEPVHCEQHPEKIEYETYPFALSRLMLFSGYRIVENVQEVARIVRDGKIDLGKEVMVETAIPIVSSPKESKSLAYNELTYDHIRVTIDGGNTSRILLFNDSYNSGWKTSADGRELEVIPANGISMAVVLPEDAKVVDLVFQPKGTYYFKLIHRLGLVLLFVSLMVGLFKQKAMHRVKSYMF